MLGYGGHFLTKSRRYSVTFGQLRTARAQYRRATRPPDADRDAWGRRLDETVVLVLPVIWTYDGIGRHRVGSRRLQPSVRLRLELLQLLPDLGLLVQPVTLRRIREPRLPRCR